MAKIKVLAAVINGCGEGSIVSVTDAEAAHYEKVGYAERVVEPVKAAAAKPAPKTKPKQTEKADQ